MDAEWYHRRTPFVSDRDERDCLFGGGIYMEKKIVFSGVQPSGDLLLGII